MFYPLQQKSSASRSLPGSVDCRELKRAVSFLMDHLNLMTTPYIFHTVLELQQCVAYANDQLTPSVRYRNINLSS